MSTMVARFVHISKNLPDFCKSHWLLRAPLSIVFIQQGISKIPVTAQDAESFSLPLIVWFFVAWGELFAGMGIILGGLLEKYSIGDISTRFSGIVMTGIMSGVILVGEPDSFIDILLYDNLHVMLYVGGLFFALRGNKA